MTKGSEVCSAWNHPKSEMADTIAISEGFKGITGITTLLVIIEGDCAEIIHELSQPGFLAIGEFRNPYRYSSSVKT
jgi:hypothetical protein